MTYDDVPGFREQKDAYGETTVVVERERLLDAARFLRDERGFNFLADVSPADYLGWPSRDVAGYWGTHGGRDIYSPGSAGLSRQPSPRPKRFSVSYHLLAVRDDPLRVRLQVWAEEGEPVASVIGIWPSADWFEREAWDLMGVTIEGHPNLARLIMDDDWAGHPLRKDYPIGGEPVRFSEAE